MEEDKRKEKRKRDRRASERAGQPAGEGAGVDFVAPSFAPSRGTRCLKGLPSECQDRTGAPQRQPHAVFTASAVALAAFCTMHLLGLFSLGYYLAAAAVVLLLAREPAIAAAYESGQGYYEEEPDLGEAKVSGGPGCWPAPGRSDFTPR